MLLAIYIASFIIGGILLGASMVLGHHELDGGGAHFDSSSAHDLPAHLPINFPATIEAHDMASDHPVTVDFHSEFQDFWLPFLSVRFWIFFLCFFGLTGVVFSLFHLAKEWVSLLSATTMGGGCGFAASYIIQRLKKAEVSSIITEEDFKGQEGVVLLPLVPGGKGKVRLEIRGQVIDLIAQNDEAVELAIGERVVVIDLRDTLAIVIKANELETPN